MRTFRRHAVRAVLALALGGSPVAAAPLTLDAVDSGQYRSTGEHLFLNQNYQTGVFETIERRSFFVFDLSSVTGTINSATLRLFNPEVSQFLHGYVSPDPTETLNLFDVTTDVDSVTLGLGGVAAFDDLGSGALYGTRVVSAADNGTVIEIALNATAIAALNAATGLFALGGALGTIDGTADQYVFGFSMTAFVADHTRELVLDVAGVPEPALTMLLMAGAAAYGSARVRQTRRTTRTPRV